MPRTARYAPGGLIYHAMNRAVARLPLFRKQAHYAAFERVIEEAHQRVPLDILAYCVMPNHWHFVLRPRSGSQLTDFLRWLAHTHTMRWHAHFHTAGTGHLYQGRFKAFPLEDDEHFYTVARYVERNALRASLVERAEEWHWSSLWRRVSGDAKSRALLAPWPLPYPRAWLELVNTPQTEAELDAVRKAIRRGSPLGGEQWKKRIAKRLRLESTLRPRGRPTKSQEQ
ncbi:MAG: transposase [Pirellulales bacterium]